MILEVWGWGFGWRVNSSSLVAAERAAPWRVIAKLEVKAKEVPMRRSVCRKSFYEKAL